MAVKLSAMIKCSRQSDPYRDAWPFVRALIDAYGPDALVWGSDWPFLRAPERIDYGPLLGLVERLLPDPAERRKVLWDTPVRCSASHDRRDIAVAADRRILSDHGTRV